MRYILAEILRNCGSLKGKKLLKAAPRNQIIWAELGRAVADMCLINMSKKALQVATTYFPFASPEAHYVHGGTFNIPFQRSSFDIVKSGRDVENFEGDPQVKIPQSKRAFFSLLERQRGKQKRQWLYDRGTSLKTLKDTSGLQEPALQDDCSFYSKADPPYFSNVLGSIWPLLRGIPRFFTATLSIGFLEGVLLIIAPGKEQ